MTLLTWQHYTLIINVAYVENVAARVKGTRFSILFLVELNGASQAYRNREVHTDVFAPRERERQNLI